MPCLDWMSWLLVLVGWYVVHLTTLQRERRKENRDFSSQVVDDLYTLSRNGRKFHLSKQYDEEIAFDIVQSLGRTFRTVNLEPISELKIDARKLMAVRMAVTLNNFDKSSFVRQDASSELVREIALSIEDLASEIETRSRSVFR